MNIRTEEKGKATVCYIDGEVNLSTSPQLKAAFDKLINSRIKNVAINFSNVTYIDSSGLATLVELFKKMRAYGGILKLTNLSPKIRNLFEITKLEKLFDINDTEEGALGTF